jgi:serine/threonine protein kinase
LIAEDTNNNRYTIKEFCKYNSQEDADDNTNEDDLKSIRQEIEIVKDLNHSNIVRLIEVIDDPQDRSLFMVMEMCMWDVIMRVDNNTSAKGNGEDTCWICFTQLLSAVEYLHSKGIVHNDIKPANILVTGQDVLKLANFGSALSLAMPFSISTTNGEPVFRPPERYLHDSDMITYYEAIPGDIWGLGVTLYCLRYGKVPFRGDIMAKVYDAIQNSQPSFGTDSSTTFVDLVKRLLAKNPRERISLASIRDHPWVVGVSTLPWLRTSELHSSPTSKRASNSARRWRRPGYFRLLDGLSNDGPGYDLELKNWQTDGDGDLKQNDEEPSSIDTGRNLPLLATGSWAEVASRGSTSSTSNVIK